MKNDLVTKFWSIKTQNNRLFDFPKEIASEILKIFYLYYLSTSKSRGFVVKPDLKSLKHIIEILYKV